VEGDGALIPLPIRRKIVLVESVYFACPEILVRDVAAVFVAGSVNFNVHALPGLEFLPPLFVARRTAKDTAMSINPAIKIPLRFIRLIDTAARRFRIAAPESPSSGFSCADHF
jgi:hypothetical protein